MRTRSKKWSSTSAVVGALAIAAVFGPAAAADDPLSPLAQGYYDYLVGYGVDDATAAGLAADLDQGIYPDSTAGVEPVSQYEIDGVSALTTVSVYADGSISTTDFQRPTQSGGSSGGGVSPMGITNCGVQSGSGYANFSNCAVGGGNYLHYISFKANYTIVNGGYDRITSTWSPSRQCTVGTCSVPAKQSNAKMIENSQGEAHVTYYMDYTVVGGWGSKTVGLTLTVGANKATASFG